MSDQPTVEELFSVLLFLLSRQALEPSPAMPTAIREHLLRLARHPDAARLPLLRKTSRRLAVHWGADLPEAGAQCPATLRAAGVTLH
jgi:hypothetical protein